MCDPKCVLRSSRWVEEEAALEEAARVGVFFAFGETVPGETSLFIVLPSLLSRALGPGVCGGHTESMGNPAAQGSELPVLLQVLPRSHVPVSHWFLALFSW